MTFVDKVKGEITPEVRRYLYRVAGAVLAIAGLYGLLSADEVAAYAVAIATLLGVPAAGLASKHTPAGGAHKA